MELLEEFPSGPLDEYRSTASFNWKLLRLHLDSSEIIKAQTDAYSLLESDTLFAKPDHELTMEEYRHLAFLRVQKLYKTKLFDANELDKDKTKDSTLSNVILAFDDSLIARSGLLKRFSVATIKALGTDRHQKYIAEAMDDNIGFCFSITEIAHGTNTRELRTEARYDIESESFILNTPDFKAAKCWSGCLAKTATHAVLFAKLYTPDNKCHGLHWFVVPIRNPKTMIPYPGITIFDMGLKIGLNGLDNGVLQFNKYKIPRENLLNRTGDVLQNGAYVSPYVDASKKFGLSLGNLSIGRLGIVSGGVVNLQKCLAIAVRYSAIRKQFGPVGKEEISVIEYPLQQWRLFPYIASMVALHIFSIRFRLQVFDFSRDVQKGENDDRMDLLGQEIHALSCCAKPFAVWESQSAIQECREACGGHGYLKAAGLGKMRDDNDASLTFEGDNNVLLQQSSNWLLSLWRSRNKGSMENKLPMGTALFLGDGDEILKRRWGTLVLRENDEDRALMQSCLMAFEWLIVWLCDTISTDIKSRKKTVDSFTLKNETQNFRAHSLSLIYVQHVIGLWFLENIEKADKSLQPVLQRLCTLFLLSKLRNHVHLMYEGGFLNDPSLISRMQFHIKRLLREILPDAVTLVDCVAPPDFILDSVLGMSDGKVYEHLYKSMITAPNALSRDKYWNEMYPERITAKL